jgi:hypothetical protein
VTTREVIIAGDTLSDLSREICSSCASQVPHNEKWEHVNGSPCEAVEIRKFLAWLFEYVELRDAVGRVGKQRD